MAKKNSRKSSLVDKVYSNGVHKTMTKAEKAGVKPISAWSWFLKNFGVVYAVLLVVTPLGLIETWDSSAMWIPIGLFLFITGLSIYYGIKMYNRLVKDGYVKRFGEK